MSLHGETPSGSVCQPEVPPTKWMFTLPQNAEMAPKVPRPPEVGSGLLWAGLMPPVFAPSQPHLWSQSPSQWFWYAPARRRRLCQFLSHDLSQPEFSSQLSGCALLHVLESPSRRPTTSSSSW